MVVYLLNNTGEKQFFDTLDGKRKTDAQLGILPHMARLLTYLHNMSQRPKQFRDGKTWFEGNKLYLTEERYTLRIAVTSNPME